MLVFMTLKRWSKAWLDQYELMLMLRLMKGLLNCAACVPHKCWGMHLSMALIRYRNVVIGAVGSDGFRYGDTQII